MLLLLLACSSGAPADAPAATPAAADRRQEVQLDPASTVEASPASPLPSTAVDPGGAIYGMRGVDHACAPCIAVGPEHIAALTASSVLDDAPAYAASMLFDGKPETAWCEGVPGEGVPGEGPGQTVRVELKRPMMLDAVGLRGGYFKNAELLGANGRVRSLRLRASNGQDQVLHFADPTVPLRWDPSLGSGDAARVDPAGWFTQARDAEIARHSARPEGAAEDPTPVTWIELELLQVWPGSRYQDTCISEVELLVVDPEEL